MADKGFTLTGEQVLRELSAVAFGQAGDETGSELKYASKLKALEMLCKHLGLLGDKKSGDKAEEAGGESGVVLLPPVQEAEEVRSEE